jgi:hypothetical protein
MRRTGRARRPLAIIWADLGRAAVAHLAEGDPQVDRMELDPPVARAPVDDTRRLERIVRFLHTVEAEIVASDDLIVLGPDPVHEQLADRLRERDGRYAIRRTITGQPAARLSDRQLVARLRRAGDAAARSRAGAGGTWLWPEAATERYEEILRWRDES